MILHLSQRHSNRWDIMRKKTAFDVMSLQPKIN